MLMHILFLPVAILGAIGVVPTIIVKRAFLSYLWRLPKARLLEYAREFAETKARAWFYPELLEEIQRHRNAGRVLVLNTASPGFYASEIARLLGFNHCIATRVILEDPMPLLPKIDGPNNKNDEKIIAMQREVPASSGLNEQERGDCWSYSDSHADLPLLEFTGNPVLVHPRPSLRSRFPKAAVLTPQRPYQTLLGDVSAALRQAMGLFGN